jgi:hypothetical protein
MPPSRRCYWRNAAVRSIRQARASAAICPGCRPSGGDLRWTEAIENIDRGTRFQISDYVDLSECDDVGLR